MCVFGFMYAHAQTFLHMLIGAWSIIYLLIAESWIHIYMHTYGYILVCRYFCTCNLYGLMYALLSRHSCMHVLIQLLVSSVLVLFSSMLSVLVLVLWLFCNMKPFTTSRSFISQFGFSNLDQRYKQFYFVLTFGSCCRSF